MCSDQTRSKFLHRAIKYKVNANTQICVHASWNVSTWAIAYQRWDSHDCHRESEMEAVVSLTGSHAECSTSCLFTWTGVNQEDMLWWWRQQQCIYRDHILQISWDSRRVRPHCGQNSRTVQLSTEDRLIVAIFKHPELADSVSLLYMMMLWMSRKVQGSNSGYFGHVWW